MAFIVLLLVACARPRSATTPTFTPTPIPSSAPISSPSPTPILTPASPTITAAPVSTASPTPTLKRPTDAGPQIEISETGESFVTLPNDQTKVSMVEVREGNFIMGATQDEQQAALSFGWSANWHARIQPLVISAGPPHIVYLDSFYIDKYEVTNDQYGAFIDLTGHRFPAFWNRSQFNDPDQPVVGVSWGDAHAFCAWAGKRLPQEAEWEKAARGLQGLAYPWGNDWDPDNLRTADDIADSTLENFEAWSLWRIDAFTTGSELWPAEVGSYPAGASPYGAMDMAGNVWEWVADWYDPVFYFEDSAQSNPEGPETGVARVLRGGAWDVPKSVAHTWFRENFIAPEHRDSPVTGFRCAMTP